MYAVEADANLRKLACEGSLASAATNSLELTAAAVCAWTALSPAICKARRWERAARERTSVVGSYRSVLLPSSGSSSAMISFNDSLPCSTAICAGFQ